MFHRTNCCLGCVGYVYVGRIYQNRGEALFGCFGDFKYQHWLPEIVYPAFNANHWLLRNCMYLLHGYLFLIFHITLQTAFCKMQKPQHLVFLWNGMSNRITYELHIQVHSDLRSASLSLYTFPNQRNHYDFDNSWQKLLFVFLWPSVHMGV